VVRDGNSHLLIHAGVATYGIALSQTRDNYQAA
jgi:hypothetical protein